MSHRQITALILVWGATVAAPGSANAEPAPLPGHFVADPLDERHTHRAQLMPVQRGVYAHGHAGPKPDTTFSGPVCEGSDGEQNAVIARIPGDGMTEFWFYATHAQGVLFSRRASLDSTKPCAEALRYHFDVDRAYVADGFIHRLSVEGSKANSLGSLALTHSAGQYSGGFYLIHNLMARPSPGRNAGKGRERIAGVMSRCHGDSGIVWSTVCVAATGPARGMLLRARAGDDEQSLFSVEIKELRTNTSLPGSVFELDRMWQRVGNAR